MYTMRGAKQRQAHFHRYRHGARRTRLLWTAAALVVVAAGAFGTVKYIRAAADHTAGQTLSSDTRRQPDKVPASHPTTAILPDTHALGIAAGSSLPSLSAAQLAQRLDGIKATGARWVRLDFDWSLIQPDASSSYDWSTYDAIVAAIAKRNLSVLGILDYTPAWARPAACQSSPQCAPKDPEQFAAFASSVAKRYAPWGVHHWEVWNEPNNPSFWQPAAQPADYTALLRATYGALHTADANAYVITAGLSPQATGNGAYAPYDFLAAIYQDGAHGYFDAVGDHPYTFPLSPASNADHAWAQMADATHSLRSLMVQNGDSAKKIWITEFGAPTGGPGPVSTVQNPNLAAQPYVVDQALQAKLLTDALRLYSGYSWAGPFFYYTYQDPGTDPSTNENFFGLITAGGAHKPAYDVFRAAAAAGE